MSGKILCIVKYVHSNSSGKTRTSSISYDQFNSDCCFIQTLFTYVPELELKFMSLAKHVRSSNKYACMHSHIELSALSMKFSEWRTEWYECI